MINNTTLNIGISFQAYRPPFCQICKSNIHIRKFDPMLPELSQIKFCYLCTDKNHLCDNMKRRKLILMTAAVLSMLSGCTRPANRQEEFETGKYYCTEAGGRPVFFQIEKNDGEGLTGHFYSVDKGSAIAVRHGFSVRKARRKYIISCEGKEQKVKPGTWSYKPYTEPEFILADTRLYREQNSEVEVTDDIVFGHVRGYWDSLPGVEADAIKGFSEGYIKSFKHRDIDLTLDLYQPENTAGPRPLILFIHGGAFYVGDKKEPAYIDFCRYFSSLGYITASMNYRMGFHVGKGEIERAGYVALQDAHAAMRFLVANADKYGIDTSELYVAGSSAGSITALNLAFMREEQRPESSYGGKGFFNRDDLGGIERSGNDIEAEFSIRAVANMWGAISTLDILKNSRTDIISFHGEADEIVPYGEGYPFSSAGKIISRSLSEPMFGSSCIDSTARALGLRSEFYSFPGKGHAFNTTGREKQPNDLHRLIREQIMNFFYTEMVPETACILDDRDGDFSVSPDVSTTSWKVEGGFIISMDGPEIRVLWRSDADQFKLTASGTYKNGIGYVTSMIPEVK